MASPCGYAQMRELLAAIKALGDENRLRIVKALEDRELCVCQIVELLRLAPSTVSKHMSILKEARLVESRKEGRWMYYRLANHAAAEAPCQVSALVSRLLAKSPKIRQDTRRLKQILKQHPQELCRQQNRC